MLLSNSSRSNSNSNSSSSEYRTNMEMSIKINAKEASMAALKCPRCNSTNTKFCYYNNYSLSQPRHFCKACKRYWTRGGTLRNVPVGGGCRKNKRAKKHPSHPHPSSSSTSSAVHHSHHHPPPPPPPSSLPMLSGSTNMDFNPFNLPPIPTSFLQQPQLDGFNTLGYPSSTAATNHDQQQFFDPLLGSSLSSAAAASLLLSSIKQPVMVSCDNMQNCDQDGSLGLALLKQVKMEADHHHHHHAWVQTPCGNPFESMPANNTVVDSPSTNLFWSWNQSLGPWPDTHATNCGSSVAPLI